MGEIHHYVGSGQVSNWIYTHPMPMPLEWNIKLAMNQLSVITYFIAWLLWVPNKTNWATVRAFLLLAVLDTFLYFYNYKTNGYAPAYLWFIGFWLLSRYIIKPWPHKSKAQQ